MSSSKILLAFDGNRARVKIEGEGTFENAMMFKSAARDLVSKGAKEFVFDLHECTKLDSTFLGTILIVALEAKETEGRIQVQGANPEIKALFRGVGLDRFTGPSS
jgi:anti-anti-sigma regulatory factor